MQPDGIISITQLRPPGIFPNKQAQIIIFNSIGSVSEPLDELGVQSSDEHSDSKL